MTKFESWSNSIGGEIKKSNKNIKKGFNKNITQKINKNNKIINRGFNKAVIKKINNYNKRTVQGAKQKFTKKNMSKIGRNIGAWGIDTAANFIADIPGVGLVLSPLLAPAMTTLSSGVKSGHVGREFKGLTAKKYFNKLAFNGIPILNNIPGVTSLQNALGQSLVHGNNKYIKKAVYNLPQSVLYDVVTGTVH